ncbi:MAG: class I SAM-dependent methyltransferase [Nitrospinae bacterium]|nr:class I SAM-dependent methyltransferase [Nitrospinota bacterium]
MFSVKEIYDFWGRFPLLYRLACFFFFLMHQHFIRTRAARFFREQRGRYMEVCCGPGVNIPYLTSGKNGGSSTWFFLDQSELMLKSFRRHNKNSIYNNKLIRADISHLPFLAETFDGIFCSLGLSVISNFELAIGELWDKIKPGGRLVIMDVKPFSGRLSFINPIILPIIVAMTGWNLTCNVDEVISRLLPIRLREDYLGGALYIVVAEK